MIVINGMEITDELVDFLKILVPKYEGVESELDRRIEQLSEINDNFLDTLVEVPTDDILKMREISNYMMNVKCMKDLFKSLNQLVKKCKVEREPDLC